MRAAPSGLRLEDVAPKRDLAEDAADGRRLVAADEIRQGVGRVAGGVETAVALGTGNRVRRRLPVGGVAVGKGRLPHVPEHVVEDRPEAKAGGRLGHDPGPPAPDGLRGFADGGPDLHQEASTRPSADGGMTWSTSPYATASSGPMNRSRSMSFITRSTV